MSTWYKTSHYRDDIEPVEVIKETASFVITKDKLRRNGESGHHKVSTFDRYHPTWEEARSWLVERNEDKLQRANKEVRDTEATLKHLRALTPPKA